MIHYNVLMFGSSHAVDNFGVNKN